MTAIQLGPQQPRRSNTDKALEALRQPGAGTDLISLLSGGPQVTGQEALPPLDFVWTWESATQKGFRLTINSLRGGLNVQRERIEKGHVRLSASSLISHHTDELILPWETQQADGHLSGAGGHGETIHAHIGGQLYVISMNSPKLFRETSQTDATLEQYPSGYSNYWQNLSGIGSGGLTGINRLLFRGNESLAISAKSGVAMYFLSVSGGNHSVHIWDLSTAVPGGNVGGPIVQTPLPGDPFILWLQGGGIYLVGSDQGGLPTDGTLLNKRLITSYGADVVLDSIGFARVGGSEPRAWWMIRGTGVMTGAGQSGAKYIVSTDSYGSNKQRLDLPVPGILSASLGRGGMAVSNSDQVFFFDGRWEPLRIFDNVKPVPGYFYYCAGIRFVDDALFAETNIVPNLYREIDIGTNPSYAWPEAVVPRQLWRYDFDIRQWAPVSEITYWRRNAGHGGGRMGEAILGPTSQVPATDLAFGPVTRTFHIFASNWSEPVQPFLRIFQQPASVNPYSLQGGTRTFAESGYAETPGLIFPSGAEYLDKYFTHAYWGGKDSGGSGSYVKVEIAEHTRLDTRPLHHEFNAGLNHASRRRVWDAKDQQTSFMIPQIRVTINRGTSTLTAQALPLTFEGYVDKEPSEEKRPGIWNRIFGRSAT